ncbi:hypothetical protein DFH08DRAFT_795851 [Mycena albidolilacea]|uniref:Uncharacterized protein n=1 Tax=Mycena albidolilacea TaxID=1033008 RepID=A0AAD7ATI7_9AGAR|nr:hypothetical protein DFH08DRAFT_795851 [Mycena albidolilacea]
MVLWLLLRTFTAFLPLKPHGMDTSSQINPELQRDTFEPRGSHPIHLLLGVNQQLTPPTSAILQRWARVMDEYPLEFYLHPVKVDLLGIISYPMSPSGPMVAPIRMVLYPRQLRLDRASIITVKTHSSARSENLTSPAAKFNRPRISAVNIGGQSYEYMVTTMNLEDEAFNCIHGDEPFADCDIGLELDTDPTSFLVAANAITLRIDLEVYFYNHNFTVDADDNYRVIIPREMGNAQKLLPVHLPRHPDCDAGDAPFFRLHLRASLTFMLLEEDISEKYPHIEFWGRWTH